MVRNYPIFRPQFEFELPVVKDIFKTGVPLTIQALIVNCGFMIMQKIANSFGVGMTASYAVSCRLELYMIVPIVSMLHAVSTFAGQNLGANKLYRLGEGVRQAILMNLCIALLVGSFCFVAAPWLISLFALKGEAYRYALSHVRVASVDLLFYAMYTPVSGLCIGIGKSFVLSVISLVELSGRIIFALLLAGVIGAGCVWWSEALAWIFVVILVFIYYNKVLRKEIENKLGEG